MTDFFETTIKNYSGLSSEIKPTIAAGSNIPNGSRWREVDTEKIYYYNIHNDDWYEFENRIIADDTRNFDTFSLLNKILKELKIMNLHMSLITDNTIDKTEVE